MNDQRRAMMRVAVANAMAESDDSDAAGLAQRIAAACSGMPCATVLRVLIAHAASAILTMKAHAQRQHGEATAELTADVTAELFGEVLRSQCAGPARMAPDAIGEVAGHA